jgi:hypothetical protein
VQGITDKNLLFPLNKLLEANDRLEAALDNTAEMWKTGPDKCWIDQINEPTPLLEKHRIRDGKTSFGF